MIAQVFECPACGDVWRGVELLESIDTDRDEVEHEWVCACGRIVEEKWHVEEDGRRVPVYHSLSEEEIEQELMADDGDDECYGWDEP